MPLASRIVKLGNSVVGTMATGPESDGMVDGVVRELRGGKPFRHLRSVV